MKIIDTHCHLNDGSFTSTLADVIARAKTAGVGIIIVPSYDMESLERTAQLAESYQGFLFPAYGLHPWFIDERYDPERIRTFLIHRNAVAVGEIGLDFSSAAYSPADRQVQVLISQLDMAVEFRLPVLLHCRKSYDQLYDILKQYRGKLQGGLHSYSGGAGGIARFMELGLHISFSGSVTRSNARKYHRTAAAVPLERMLLETDAPSIATESTLASAVEPRHVIEVALIQYCTQRDIRIISALGASSRTDPFAIRIATLSETVGCPLTRALRKHLRSKKVIADPTVLYSQEPPRRACNPEDSPQAPESAGPYDRGKEIATLILS